MSVSTMKKLSVVTMRRDAAQLMRALQKLRCVDVCRTETPPPDADLRDPAVLYSDSADETQRIDVSAEAAEATRRIADTRLAADFLARFEMKKKGLFTPVEEVSLEEFEAQDAASAEATVQRALELSDELLRAEAAELNARQEADALAAFEQYPLALPEDSTVATRTVAGSFPPATDRRALELRLADLAVVLETVRETEAGTVAALAAYRDDFEEALRILSGFGFTRAAVTADAAEGYAHGKRLAAENRAAEARARREAVRAEAVELSVRLPLVRVYADKLATDDARLAAVSRMRITGKTALLSGWIPAGAEKEVTALLDSRGDAYEIADPAEGEEAPILLANNRFASQFEPVLAMYALPKYGTYDPTFPMSIFYVLIFGLMFADAGYGLLLSLACFLFLKLAKPRGTMKPFITMFGICGLSCAFMGVLFGSYFGNLPSTLAGTFMGRETFLKPILFDPMAGQGPMYFLIISLAVGAVHLMTGLVIKMVLTWRQGHIFSAIFDTGSWLVVFLGISTYIVLNMVLHVSGTAGLVIALVGVAMIVCTAGREAKNPIMKFLKGLLGLYGIVGYASDLLSYSRILSLCLASAVIANVVNLLGTLPGPGFGSVIGLLIAFLIGHTLNMALNLLGTFVHTSRLQYIEFFGKFYEDGGRRFEPLTPCSQYVLFK